MTLGSTSALIDVLRDRQLLESSQLKDLSGSQFTTPQKLAAQLVQRNLLTTYQVSQLFAEHGQNLVLGSYRLLEPLGEGGMGQVFKALHLHLNRLVAIKVIRHDRATTSPDAIERFQREARMTANLSHPNIVIVYDADQIGDTYFIAMEYVEGIDLYRLVKTNGPLPVSLACDYIRQAALGLQHAHECGMIHRDIKPANLLVALPPTPGSKPVAGISGFHKRPILPGKLAPPEPKKPEATVTPSTPPSLFQQGGIVKILDMGLARLSASSECRTSDGSLTEDGVLMGTPDYIAPEQSRNARAVDIRADLYSLGCTLYYLLAGRTPFGEGNVIEKLLMHQLDTPQPIEELRPEVPAEVSAIISRLMAKNPDDRFQVPDALARALAPFTGSTTPELVSLKPETISNELPDTAMVKITPFLPVTAEVPRQERSNAPERIMKLRGHNGWVMSLAFSPNRNALASGGVDGAVQLWDFHGSKPRRETLPRAHQGEVHSVAFGPDNKTLASGSGTLDGIVYLWDLTGDAPVKKATIQGHKAPVNTLTFSPDGKMLATGGCDKTIWLWDLGEEEPHGRALMKGHTNYVTSLAFAPDAKRLVSGSQDGTVRLWGLSGFWARERSTLEGHAGPVQTVAFAPDGKLVASGSLDQVVRLWDVSSPQSREHAVFEGHAGVVRLVLFTPTGQELVSLSDEGLMILWDVVTRKKLREWQLPKKALICSVAMTIDGRYLATGASDGTVQVFRLYARADDGRQRN